MEAQTSSTTKESEKEKIKLESTDGQVFEVDRQVAEMCGTLAKTFMIDNDGDKPIPIACVDGATLEKVLKWAEYHRNDPTWPKTNDENGKILDVPEWDEEFLKTPNWEMDQWVLRDILAAANYLNVQGLFLNCCKIIGKMIRGKTPQQIRDTFNIPEDIEPTEEITDAEEKSTSSADDEAPSTSAAAAAAAAAASAIMTDDEAPAKKLKSN